MTLSWLTLSIVFSTERKHEDSLDPKGSLIFTILVILILVSLWGISYSRATSVHKVIALLSLSILTVFLWMWETQFLFIYLVYILAFVGAVLMLFLSVVLMLPISTLQSARNFSFLMMVQPWPNFHISAVKASSLDITGWIHNYWESVYELVIIYFFILIASFFGGTIVLASLGADFRRCLKDKGCLLMSDLHLFIKYQIIANCKINLGGRSIVPGSHFTGSPEKKYNNALFNKLSYHSFRLPIVLLEPRVWKEKIPSSIIYLANASLLLLAVLIYFFKVFSKLMLFIFEAVLKRGRAALFLYGEYIIQGILTWGLVLTASEFSGKPYFTAHHNAPVSAETSEGSLSAIKWLLYEKYSSFLILSALVLLVALIAAAVMTRNKK